MTSHKVRKFKKILTNTLPSEVNLYIEKKWGLYKADILREINDLPTLKLYSEKVDFTGISYQEFCGILKTCKYEKGVFLMELGGMDISKTKITPDNDEFIDVDFLYVVSDFRLFKYMVEVCGLPLDVKKVLNYHNNKRIIKYILNRPECKKIKKKSYVFSASLEKTKLLEEKGFPFNKKSRLYFKGEDNINYVFDKTKDLNHKLDFIANEALTPYIFKKLLKIDFMKTKSRINRFFYSLSYSAEIYMIADKEGVLSLEDLDRSGFNILTKRGINKRKLLELLPRERRRKLITQRNDNNENFLWDYQALGNVSMRDIRYLLKNGLEYNFKNNKGQSFLETAKVNFKLKQYFIDLGIDGLDIEKTLCNYIEMPKRSTVTDIISYCEYNNIPFNVYLFREFIVYPEKRITVKNIRKIFQSKTMNIKEAILEDYSILCPDRFYENGEEQYVLFSVLKKIMNLDRRDSKGSYLIYNFSPFFVSNFVNAGFNIDLIPNKKDGLSDFISDQYELDEFWEVVCKIKQEKEKKSLDSIIKVATDDNHSRKRI